MVDGTELRSGRAVQAKTARPESGLVQYFPLLSLVLRFDMRHLTIGVQSVFCLLWAGDITTVPQTQPPLSRRIRGSSRNSKTELDGFALKCNKASTHVRWEDTPKQLKE